MKTRLISRVMPLILSFTLFTISAGWTQGRSGSDAPIITGAFAPRQVMYGDIVKVYIEADDPNGDMVKIAAVVDQAGYGRYPTSWVYLKSADRKHFKGYVQWNTFSNKTPFLSEWTQTALSISVFDRAGKESNVYTFPITFESGARVSRHEVPPPFNQGDLPRLGFIDVELMDFTIFRGDQ